MKKYNILIILVLSVFVASCQKDEIPPVDIPTDDEEARDALWDVMTEWYYWYKELPQVNLSEYSNPAELMNALRYKPLDRWSYIIDYEYFNSIQEGSFVGHGIRMGLDPGGKVRIVMIYKNSPLYEKGVRRGWIVKQVNGTDLAPIFLEGDGAAYSTLMGPSQAGITNTFLFGIPDGRDSTITSTKIALQVNSVTYYDTLQLKSGLTGYLVFDEFIEPSSEELDEAFTFFRENNVKDLILDLRYNSGGLLDAAVDLASYIAGPSLANSPFIRMEHNDKKNIYNSTKYFKSLPNSLSLTKLLVITTRETASASEEVINGLIPHIQVTTIGDTTNGKPTGMYAFTYSTLYYFLPITFKLTNSDSQGDFFDGFAPAKYVTDDITHDWKDRNESCIKEAIRYLETGNFSAKSSYIAQPSVPFMEKPDWMGNTIEIFKPGDYK